MATEKESESDGVVDTGTPDQEYQTLWESQWLSAIIGYTGRSTELEHLNN